MTSLQDQWRAAQVQRQQELADRTDAVHSHLTTLSQQRIDQAQALRSDLNQFREALALEGELFQEQCQQQDQGRAQVASQRRVAVSQQVQALQADRLRQEQELRSDLAEFRSALAQEQAQFLSQAQAEDRVRQQVAQQRRAQAYAQVAQINQSRRIQAQALRQDLSRFRQQVAQRHVAATQTRRSLHQSIAQSVAAQAQETQHFVHQASQLRQIQADAQQQDLREHRAALHKTVWGEGGVAPKAVPQRRSAQPARPPAPRSIPTRSAAAPAPKPAPAPAAPPAPVAAPQPVAAAPAPNNTQDQVYNYLKQHPGMRLADLDAPLGLTRVQVGDALRELTKQGKIRQQDRAYFVQEVTAF